MKQRSALIVSAMLTAFVLVVVGGLVANLTQSGSRTTQATEQAVPATRPLEAENTLTDPISASSASAITTNVTTISQDQAIQVASAYLGGGTVMSVELEQERGMQAYAVEFRDGSEVYVDAITGEVMAAERDHHDDTEYDHAEHDDDDD